MKDTGLSGDQLLTMYDRVAGADDAIPRLRRFVLDLAVRGKLVAQDAADEPASELLKRIEVARQATPARERKTTKRRSSDDLAKLPFELPCHWTTCALGGLVRVINGRAYKKQELLDEGTPVLRVGNLFTSKHWYYSDLTLDDDKYCDEGDLIYAWSASFGPFIWDGPRVIYHYHIWKLELFSEADLDRDFLYLFLLQKTREIKDAGHGISMIHMTKEKMEQLAVPLPPVAEQHRIVAKVAELMGLLDQLEQTRVRAEGVRARLTTATWARLTTDAADAPRNSRHTDFALKTLPSLTTTPTQIKTLRQTILNLAVRGKLVAQENVVTFAEDIQRLERLRAARFLCVTKKADQLRADKEFDALRHSWETTPELPRRINTFCACHFITKGTTPSKEKLAETGDVPFLKVYNIVQNDLDFHYKPSFTTYETHAGLLARSKVFPGDVIMNIVGPPLGKVAIVTDDYPEWNINQALVFFRPLDGISNQYLALMLQATDTLKEVLTETRGTVGQDNLSLEQVRSISFPFISLVEQHRIVAKVDALMALCDQLETALTTTGTTKQRLLETLISRALSPDAELSEAAE